MTNLSFFLKTQIKIVHFDDMLTDDKTGGERVGKKRGDRGLLPASY